MFRPTAGGLCCGVDLLACVQKDGSTNSFCASTDVPIGLEIAFRKKRCTGQSLVLRLSFPTRDGAMQSLGHSNYKPHAA